ncbi:MAG: tRNA (adenosine(37)-N6)-threonylcarbamoyltransferase complex dimerization subunit type 1 TsaB [Bauldia sp.]|nr:tRNA (adenosine(37)-N6)-threonylcarbamoyltransferase complex dimerization subunit type 1 TsaB [Bauldia sp.]
MIVLAIDTALEACSVAIGRPEGAPVIRTEIIGRGHGERLFGMVSEVMAEARVAFADIGRFAVTVGPGSFTGIRVGVAAVRGFALVTGKPAVGISTLTVHAAEARALGATGPVLALLDARAGGVYLQRFDGDGRPSGDAEAANIQRATEFAAGTSLAGSGARAIAAITGQPIVHERSAPDPATLLALAMTASPDGPPRPLYLRPPDATPAKAAALPRR